MEVVRRLTLKSCTSNDRSKIALDLQQLLTVGVQGSGGWLHSCGGAGGQMCACGGYFPRWWGLTRMPFIDGTSVFSATPSS